MNAIARATRRVRLWLAAGIVVAVVLVTAGFRASPTAAPETAGVALYRPSSESLPRWAKAGNIRFMRLDGGRIESRKAERTWWGFSFTKEEKEVLADIYTQHFDRMLGLLEQARFNWIWVTWSNGWSFREEAENREQLRRVIDKCHSHGIKVTAYLSASNLFWWSTFRDEPETRRWLLTWHGLPIPYGASPHRLLADVRQPGWRAYLRRKVELALDAGVDGIFYDNIFGELKANRLLLSETQQLAESKARQTGRPKALVHANVHLAPERFDLAEHCDLVWDESGKDSPGVWADGWQVDNIRKIKFLSGEKQTWQPLLYENDLHHCGPRETCIPSPVEQKLSIAEAQAFGAALSRNIEGWFLKALIHNQKPAVDAWSAIALYNRFLDENRTLFSGAQPVARIALLSRGQENPVADNFIRQSVLFESKVLRHLDKGVPLERFGALVIPFAVGELDASQRSRLAAFVMGGGTVFAADPQRLQRSLGLATGRLRPITSELAREVRAAAGGPSLIIRNAPNVLAQITKKPLERGTTGIIVHLMNYQQRFRAQHVAVELNLASELPAAGEFEIKLLSPDGPARLEGISRKGSVVSFTVSSIRHYSVAVLSIRR